MAETVHVTVFRRFDNREEGLSDDSPRALELHRLRNKAMHEVLDGVANWKVKDWGAIDDKEAHEVVEAILEIMKSPEVQMQVSEGLHYISSLLITAGVSAVASESIKMLFSRLRRQQEEKRVTNVYIKPSPTIQIQMDPPEYGGNVYVSIQVEESTLTAPNPVE